MCRLTLWLSHFRISCVVFVLYLIMNLDHQQNIMRDKYPSTPSTLTIILL